MFGCENMETLNHTIKHLKMRSLSKHFDELQQDTIESPNVGVVWFTETRLQNESHKNTFQENISGNKRRTFSVQRTT